ncbi:MAG: hypothetical protein ACI4QE_03350, partial [Acutalibacteraceae bacterium]
MAKILIYLAEFDAGQQYDIWNKCSKEDYYSNYLKSYPNKNLINYGNKLWFQSLVSVIDTPENQIDFNNRDLSYDEINSNYDMVINPQANMFAPYFSEGIKRNSERFSHFKIPVYIIACGVQADSYDHIDELIRSIGEESKDFISAVYNTGGEFALRGDFTK